MLKNLNKKQKIELIITGIGIIFLIFLVMGNLNRVQKKKRSMIKRSNRVSSSMSAPISIEKRGMKESVVKGDWGRDPFSLSTSASLDAGLEGLILNGIMWDKDNPYAIINSDIVKAGDKLRGMNVLEITEKHVILEENGKRYTLRLKVF
jgi:type II secretory pathway component PulC